MSAVPRRTLRGSSPGAAGRSAATPTSTTQTSAPGLGGDRVDDRGGREEVRHHLGGDLLRPRGDALGVHAVVPGEHGDRGGLGQRRRALPRDPGQPDRQVLEEPERAGRLGELGLALAGGAGRRAVRRPDGGHRVGEQAGGLRARQAALPPAALVHGPGEGPLPRPARHGQLRRGRELRHVPDAQVGHHLDVRGQPERRRPARARRRSSPSRRRGPRPGPPATGSAPRRPPSTRRPAAARAARARAARPGSGRR